MREILAADPSRTIRFFNSFEEQEEEDIRYWNSVSMEEKMRLTVEFTVEQFRQKGIDASTQGSDRSLVCVQRA